MSTFIQNLYYQADEACELAKEIKAKVQALEKAAGQFKEWAEPAFDGESLAIVTADRHFRKVKEAIAELDKLTEQWLEHNFEKQD